MKGRSVSVSPDGTLALVVNDDVELWQLGETPAALQRWSLAGITSAALSADNKSIFAVRGADLIVFSSQLASVEPQLLSAMGRRVGNNDKRLVSTDKFLMVQIGSKIRVWSILENKWVHEIDSQMNSEITLLPGDRMADWSSSRVIISDLSAADGVGFISGQLQSDCGEDRGRKIQLLDFSVSNDGSHAVLACGNGIVKVISALDATPVSSAPFENETPWAAGIDQSGRSFFAFTSASGSASVSTWLNFTRSSPQIGGGEVARLSRSISLSSSGTVAGIFHSPQGSKLVTFDSKTEKLLESSWDGGEVRDPSVAIGQAGSRLVYASGGEIKISGPGETSLAGNGKCLAEVGAAETSLTVEDNILAVIDSAKDGARITVCKRRKGGWQAERAVDAASWTVSASPDPIKLLPFAVSSVGSIAYLKRENGTQEPGRTINIELSTGKRLTMEQPSQVTVLAFAQDETLLLGDRSGSVRAISIRSAKPVMRILGQHTGRIVAIVTSKDSRVLSIGSENIVRMWDLDFTEEMVGLSGVMEFPLVSSGISGVSYLGAAGVALDDDRLVTLNQTARGVFAHVWKVPTGANLLKEAEARLGPARRERGQ